jgi:hypothetical protein
MEPTKSYETSSSSANLSHTLWVNPKNQELKFPVTTAVRRLIASFKTDHFYFLFCTQKLSSDTTTLSLTAHLQTTFSTA